MKRRFADARSNPDILEKEFKSIRVDNEYFNGYIAKLKILKEFSKRIEKEI